MKVDFYWELNPYTDQREVLAVFPAEEKAELGCYAHIGQHSSCDITYVKN